MLESVLHHGVEHGHVILREGHGLGSGQLACVGNLIHGNSGIDCRLHTGGIGVLPGGQNDHAPVPGPHEFVLAGCFGVYTKQRSRQRTIGLLRIFLRPGGEAKPFHITPLSLRTENNST